MTHILYCVDTDARFLIYCGEGGRRVIADGDTVVPDRWINDQAEGQVRVSSRWMTDVCGDCLANWLETFK